MGGRGSKGKEKERCRVVGIACAKARMVMVLWENSRELEYRPINWMQAAAFQCTWSRTRREPCKPHLGFGWVLGE